MNQQDAFRTRTRGIGRIRTHSESLYIVPRQPFGLPGPALPAVVGSPKLIVYQKTRADAIATMRRALQEFTIEPIKTTIPACQEILSHNLFVKNKIDTGFVERNFLDIPGLNPFNKTVWRNYWHFWSVCDIFCNGRLKERLQAV
jgi:acetyl-CoA carboxylase biotin carboxylase subunit